MALALGSILRLRSLVFKDRPIGRPSAPPGFVFLLGADGAQLLGADGAPLYGVA